MQQTRRQLDGIETAAIIDLSDVGLLSAAGLTELVRVARGVGVRAVTLTGASPMVRRVLDIVRFGELFIIK